MKLRKLKEASGWQGNYVPQDAAEWCLADHPHITIRKTSGGGYPWIATNTQTNQYFARGETRAALLKSIQNKLGE